MQQRDHHCTRGDLYSLPIRAEPVWQAVMAVFLCAAAPGHSMRGDEGEVVEPEVGTAGITRN